MNAIDLTHKYIASQRNFQNYHNSKEIKIMLNKLMTRLFGTPKSDDIHLNKQLVAELPSYIKRDIGMIDKDINNYMPHKGKKSEAIKYGQLWI